MNVGMAIGAVLANIGKHGLRVTFPAFPFARASFKLPFVRIGVVTIHTPRVRHRSLKISICVAAGARDSLMLSKQRKMGCRVIEAGSSHFLRPIGRVVAGFASRSKGTLVGVCVARGAFVERKPYVLDVRLRVSDCRMVFVAGDCSMRACECEL